MHGRDSRLCRFMVGLDASKSIPPHLCGLEAERCLSWTAAMVLTMAAMRLMATAVQAESNQVALSWKIRSAT